MEQNGSAVLAWERVSPFLEGFTKLPFVRKVELVETNPTAASQRYEAIIRVNTDAGAFDFLTEVKKSYLDVAVVRRIVAAGRDAIQQQKRVLLLARYIPQPTAQHLLDVGIDFADLAGNMHLRLDPHYHWTVLGNREGAGIKRPVAWTAATLQLLFTCLACPESAEWTVRKLAEHAGVGKSKAASVSRDFLRNRTLRKVNGRFLPFPPRDFADQLLAGYRQILRPRLAIGRFRTRGNDFEELLGRLRHEEEAGNLEFSLTGGLAAFRLQRFYQGLTMAAYVRPNAPDLPRRLRLLPDWNGSVALLKGFGDLAFWKELEGVRIAHPWLIYAELMSEADPRSHESAQELRTEILDL